MKIIDSHCHIGSGKKKNLDAGDLIGFMDKNDIERSVVVPVEEYIAVNNEEGNEYVYRQILEYGDRLIGFATANPWYGEKAVDIIKKYLDKGFKGIKLDASIQGFKINDEMVYPIIRAAVDYKVPVYFHTGTPVTSMPFQLYELAVHFPQAVFIMGHSGFSDFSYDLDFIARMSKNIYFETSMNLTANIKTIITTVGSKRVLFGSNMPRSNYECEKGKILLLELDRHKMDDIFHCNINFLLGGEAK